MQKGSVVKQLLTHVRGLKKEAAALTKLLSLKTGIDVTDPNQPQPIEIPPSTRARQAIGDINTAIPKLDAAVNEIASRSKAKPNPARAKRSPAKKSKSKR
jgi:hypothetical protein